MSSIPDSGPKTLLMEDIARATDPGREEEEGAPPRGQLRRFRDPRVVAWGEEQGPRLNGTCRAVFSKMCEFVNPETGEAWPSQETLAEALDMSRVTVNRAIQEVNRVHPGMMTVRQVPRPDGKFAFNVYRMNGLDSAWHVTTPKGRESVIQTPAKRIVELAGWLSQALRLLEANGIEHGMDFPVSACDTDTIERETDSDRVSDLYTVYTEDGEGLSLPQHPVTHAEINTVPPPDPVEEFVDGNLDKLIEGGWKHRGGILRVFREDPAEMERWRRLLEDMRPVGERYRDALEETGPPEAQVVSPDPVAEEVWNAVLPRLASGIPKPSYETWLRRTCGVSMDAEAFVVGVPTPFVAQQLERRMYHAIKTAVREQTGNALEVRFIVANLWQEDEG